MIELRFRRLPHAKELPLPVYESKSAAGMDIRAALTEPVTLNPGERTLIPTGLQMALPEGYEAQIRPRSGLAIRNAINHGNESFTIHHGDRIAQMVIAPVVQLEIRDVKELDDTERGTGGFGSTGVN